MIRNILLALLLGLAFHGVYPSAQGPVFKLIYSPSASSNVGYIYSIFEIEPGRFSVLNTMTNSSSIFTITSTGAFQTTYSFPSYASVSNMFQDTNGRFYAPAGLGPNYQGAYYAIDPAAKDPRHFPISPPWDSTGRSVVAPAGNLYDILATSGPSQTFAFATVTPSGNITLLYQLSSSDGQPNSNMVQGSDGNFYGVGGVTLTGGGTAFFIFRVTPTGSYSRLLTFPSYPTHGIVPLMSASDGNLYGTFMEGGTNNTGEIFQATLSGQLQTVASFPASGMSEPLNLMEAADGNLYGSTNFNQIFRFNLATHALNLVYQMAADGSQGKCSCNLIEGMDGKLYGVAPYGGSYPGVGAIFSVEIGLPKPKPGVNTLYPASGPVGKEVTLWGNYLLKATSISFNGTPAASISSNWMQSVKAVVPAGATTGPVTITTANGSFTTRQSFTVQ
jgi:uncharacterized repeat protein (TIGR03803 family)